MLQYCSVIVYLGISAEFEVTEELIFISSLHETTTGEIFSNKLIEY